MESEELKPKDAPIFENTTFSSLLQDIYKNSTNKRKQIDILINELRPLIKQLSDAVQVVPLIKEYMEVGVKNDEQLVKMAGVYQKFIAAEIRGKEGTNLGGNGLLTDAEKAQLLDEIKEESTQLVEKKEKVSHSLDGLIKKVDELKIPLIGKDSSTQSIQENNTSDAMIVTPIGDNGAGK